MFIYTSVRLRHNCSCNSSAKAFLRPPEGSSKHTGHALCLTANAKSPESASESITGVQVVLFNALSSEPEDGACIRLTGVSGGLQVSRSSHQSSLPMHASDGTQCLEVI